MSFSDSNILIVGQGIAGTLLSYKLWQNKITHTVIDNNHKYAATHAAAGIINPITGRNYVKSWMIDHLLPEAKSTYTAIGKLLQSTYFREINILRTLHTPAQENKWISAVDKPGYDDYIVELADTKAYTEITNSAKSYGEIKRSAQVDISRLIRDYRSFLIENEMYLDTELDYSDIVFSDREVSYKDHSYNFIIFCEGFKALQNPFFETSHFRPAKGESLSIMIDQDQPDKILRDDIFLAPTHDRNYWTGGTYVWDFKDDLPTEDFKKKWIEKLDSLTKVPYKIKEHRAGVRPSTKDRRPFLGVSYQSKLLYIFNGMGTKGTSLVPYWAEHLIEHLRNGTPINASVNINRF